MNLLNFWQVLGLLDCLFQDGFQFLFVFEDKLLVRGHWGGCVAAGHEGVVVLVVDVFVNLLFHAEFLEFLHFCFLLVLDLLVPSFWVQEPLVEFICFFQVLLDFLPCQFQSFQI